VELSRTAIFSVFAPYFSETLRDEASVIIYASDMQSVVSFTVIRKYITFDDLESLFRVKLFPGDSNFK